MVCVTPQLFLLVYPHANVGPPVTILPTQSSSCCLALCPLCLGCPSPPLLLVWMNVSSLTPWLLDLDTVRFSGRSSCFLFLNLLSFLWLCKEAKCIYLHLHLGGKFHCHPSLSFLYHLVSFLCPLCLQACRQPSCARFS